jgi:hypothetical protein
MERTLGKITALANLESLLTPSEAQAQAQAKQQKSSQ